VKGIVLEARSFEDAACYNVGVYIWLPNYQRTSKVTEGWQNAAESTNKLPHTKI
jgi:hypothetical protein